MAQARKKEWGGFFFYLFLVMLVVILAVVKLDVKEATHEPPKELKAIQTNKVADAYQASKSNELLGTWTEINPESGDQYIKFLNDHSLELGDDNGSTKVEYETIRNIEPNQLYIYVNTERGNERIPFGIFKIQGDVLLWRDSTETQDSSGLVLPIDFSADTTKFKKFN